MIRRLRNRHRAMAAPVARRAATGCPVRRAARAARAASTHRRAAGPGVGAAAVAGPPADGGADRPGRAGGRGGDGRVRRVGGGQRRVEQGRPAGRRSGAGARARGAGAGGGGRGKRCAGQSHPGDHATAREQCGQSDPHRQPGRAAVPGGGLLPPRLLLPLVPVAGTLAGGSLTAGGRALVRPELLRALLVSGVAAGGPVDVVHGCHGAGRVWDNGRPKLGFSWEAARVSRPAATGRAGQPAAARLPGPARA